MTRDEQKIHDSLKAVEQWVEDHAYRGYEPFDGLSSYLHVLTFDNLLLERFLQQAVRRILFNVRPLIGVTRKESTKGRGYMASGYLTMYRATKNPEYLSKASACLDWLDKNKEPHFEKHSWGNHFAFSSRSGKLPRHEPIIVWTSLIGQAYIDAFEQTGEKGYRDIIRSVCDWILALPKESTGSGTCLSYVAFRQQSIHNSNMLGAAMLARSSKHIDDARLLDTAKQAMDYSCSRQHPDGSWWYGEDPEYHWIDNFHTAYNLDSLKCYIEASGDRRYDPHLARGFEFYKDHFFLSDGTPKYYHDRTFPVDSQCVSQSVETLAKFADYDEDAFGLALRVSRWAIDFMQDKKSGYFYFRRYPHGIIDKTPMLHWAQATMYKALTLLYERISTSTVTT